LLYESFRPGGGGGDDGFEGAAIRDQKDESFGGVASFQAEDLVESPGLKGVGSDAVDGFGRVGDDAPGMKGFEGMRQFVGGGHWVCHEW